MRRQCRGILMIGIGLATWLVADAVQAASCTWTRSAGTANFNASTGYWSCGVIPDSDDDVIFSGSGTSNCTISASLSVISISINSGYTGTVTLSSGQTLTTSGAFNFGASTTGDFSGGNSTITVGTDLNMLGAAGSTFTSTSGLLDIGGAFNLTGGTFTHNSGRVVLSSATSKTFASNGATFNDLYINDGLIGYWKFDDTSSPSVDSSGYGRDATWSSTPAASSTVASVPFANAKSLSIDSSADYASYTSPATPSITIAAWVKATAAGGGNYQRIQDSPGYQFFIDGAGTTAPDNPMALGITSNRATTNGEWRSPSNSITYGTWYHIAVTYNSSSTSNDAVFYINGVSQTVTDKQTPVGAQTSNAGTSYIGNRSGVDRYLNGLIDDLRVYDRILTAAEIAAIYAGNDSGVGVATQTLTGNPVVTGDLTIASGTLAAGTTTITVGENWWNYGAIFTASTTGSAVFNGSSTGKSILTAGSSFGALTISGTGAWTISDTGNVTLGGAYAQSAGTFTSTAGRLTIGGAFNKTGGTFTHNSGHVMLNSTSSQNFASDGATFNNLTITDGLVGYWKLDEASGSTATDASGYGNTGTLTGGSTWSTTSLASLNFTNPSAVNLDGVDNFIDLGTAITPTNANFSVCAWGKMDVSTGYRTFVSTDGANVSSFYLQKRGDTGKFAFSLPGSDSIGASDNTAYGTSTPVAATWYHLCGTYDDANIRLYVNGVLETTTAFSGAWEGTGHTLIGAGLYNSAHTDWFDGPIDEVRIYNRILTDAEIYALYIGNQPASASATHTLTGNPIVAGNLVIGSGGLAGGTTSITVGGSWLNYGGLFTAGSTGLVTFNGSGSTNVIRSAGQMFGGITLNGSGTWTLNDRTEFNPASTFTATAGTIDLSTYVLRGGNLDRTSATITASTSTVVFDASSSKTVEPGSLYNVRFEPVAATNLVGYWKADEGQGTSIRDYSGSANTGTLYSTTWDDSSLPGVSFYDPAAITLSGSSGSYATLGVTNLPAVGSAMTVSLWVYYASVPGTTQNFIALMGGSNTQIGLRGSEIRAWKSGGTTLVAKSSPPASGWHHVAYTCDGAGTPTHTLTVDGGTPVSTATALTGGAVATAWLGSYNGTNELFAGKIDDVRIYNTVLTAAQINALAAGTNPAGLSGTPTYTLGANTTVTGTLSMDSGTLATSSYTVDASASGNVATVYSGTYSVGSATNKFQGGLTVNKYGTLDLPTTGGIVSIGPASAVTKILTIDGTLSASAATAATIQKTSGASNYTFTVGSTSTATPTLDITRLAVKDTDTNGMYINAVAGSATTFTNFDNIAFSSGTGNYLLRIYSESLALYANGLTFDASTTYNMKLAGNGTGDGETRAYIGATCTSTPCESYDVDDDATNDGTGDAGGATDEAVAQWMYKAYDDTAGSIEGFPTTAFNWSTFVYWNTYAVYRDFSGSTDRLFARDTDGDFKNTAGGAGYYWDLPSSVGDIIGTPRWTMEGATHYVYVITTLGYVYKLTDSGTAFALVTAQAWPYRNGASATATSPLAMDGSNIYWAGNDGSGNRKMFSLTFAMALNGTRTVVADVLATPSLASISGTTYLFTGTNGSIYRTPTNLASELTSTQPTSIVYGRTSVVNGTVYFPEDIGKVWAISGTDLTATPTGAGKWSYQDTDGTRHPGGCTAASQCTVRNIYHDSAYQRTYFGDKDGHLYVVSNTGALISGYPFRPGTSSDEFQTAPLYRAGVIVIGAVSGRVFVVDQSAAASAYQTFDFQSPVSTISYDTDGKFIVGTASGKLYYLNGVTDPTPGSL